MIMIKYVIKLELCIFFKIFTKKTDKHYYEKKRKQNNLIQSNDSPFHLLLLCIFTFMLQDPHDLTFFLNINAINIYIYK